MLIFAKACTRYKYNRLSIFNVSLTEKVGFEPTEACTSSDFKSDAIDQLCHLSLNNNNNGQLILCQPNRVI